MLDVIDLYLFISANADFVLMTMVLSPPVSPRRYYPIEKLSIKEMFKSFAKSFAFSDN